MCGYICLLTEFNQETNGTVEHLIHQSICLYMWGSDSFYFSMRMSLPVLIYLPVKRIKSRSNYNYLVFHHQVICLWTEFNQETNETVKHQSSKRFLSICGSLYLSLSVCGSCRLWTDLNYETIRTVEHQIFQVISVSMWWSVSISFSVWIHCVWKELNLETIGTFYQLKHQVISVSMWSSNPFYFSVWMNL